MDMTRLHRPATPNAAPATRPVTVRGMTRRGCRDPSASTATFKRNAESTPPAALLPPSSSSSAFFSDENATSIGRRVSTLCRTRPYSNQKCAGC